MLTLTAVSLFKTAESIATPCSVNAKGFDEECFKFLNRSQFVTSYSFSRIVSLKRNETGNLSIFLLAD